jgi:hypothetical protein
LRTDPPCFVAVRVDGGVDVVVSPTISVEALRDQARRQPRSANLIRCIECVIGKGRQAEPSAIAAATTLSPLSSQYPPSIDSASDASGVSNRAMEIVRFWLLRLQRRAAAVQITPAMAADLQQGGDTEVGLPPQAFTPMCRHEVLHRVARFRQMGFPLVRVLELASRPSPMWSYASL